MNIQKQFRIFLLLFFSFSSIKACLMADQFRQLPLGTNGAEVILLQVKLDRYHSPEEEFKPAWRMDARLVSATDHDHFVVLDTFPTAHSENGNYLSTLRPIYQEAIKMAQELPSFTPFQPEKIVYCDYQQDCIRLKVQTDPASGNSFLVLPEEQKQIPLNFEVNRGDPEFNFFAARIEENEMDAETLKEVISYMDISSVRTYKMGNRTLLAVYFGRGQVFGNADGTPPQSKITVPQNVDWSELETALFQEPLLHHGSGFDFWVWI